MQKLTENVYAETGFHGCNPGFVVTTGGVVMIDTPQIPADAIGWRDEIAKHSPVRYLINTEPHGDHFSGNYYFEGTGIAHQGTREAVLVASVDDYRERLKQMAPNNLSLLEGFRFRPPSITFTEQLTFHLGKHTFQLIHFPGHSPYQIAVFIPEERVVFTSDNVFGRVQAWLHQALPQEWLHSLEGMKELDADIFVPGHGSIGDRSCLTEMQEFIQAWIDAVKAAIDQGMSLEEAQKKVSLLDLRPMEAGSESRAQMVQQLNVARLYQVLKE